MAVTKKDPVTRALVQALRNPGVGGQGFLDAVGELAKQMAVHHDDFNDDLIEEHGLEPEERQEGIPTMPKRKVQVNVEESKDPIYTWAFKSSQPRGGQIINYIAQIGYDEVLSCNCPGWIFCKGEKKDKICKHTRVVAGEVKDILKKYRSGEPLPVFDSSDTGAGFSPAAQSRMGGSKIKIGRMIEF